MKSRKPIRVLTFSFFLLMIGFFVAWQSGWLGQLFVVEEKPQQSIISTIPDSVIPQPLDSIKPRYDFYYDGVWQTGPRVIESSEYSRSYLYSSKTMVIMLRVPENKTPDYLRKPVPGVLPLFAPDSIFKKLKYGTNEKK